MESISGDDSLREYYDRINQRLTKFSGVHNRIAQGWFLAKSAEDHFARYELPCRRYLRARGERDLASVAYERRVMLAILYEVADTAYLVMNVLDFDEIDLESSGDGYGLTGEGAADVLKVLSCLDNQCARLISLENKFDLRVDFSRPVDEKEGMTFVTHRHWQDFVAGSAEESFLAYFSRARQTVSARLNQRPRFWANQTVRQYIQAKGYRALIEILRRLEQASFVVKQVQKPTKGVYPFRHFWLGEQPRG